MPAMGSENLSRKGFRPINGVWVSESLLYYLGRIEITRAEPLLLLLERVPVRGFRHTFVSGSPFSQGTHDISTAPLMRCEMWRIFRFFGYSPPIRLRSALILTFIRIK